MCLQHYAMNNNIIQLNESEDVVNVIERVNSIYYHSYQI